MKSRRSIISSGVAVALGGKLTPVAAQAFKVPDPLELRSLLRPSPIRVESIVSGTLALRTLLWQIDPGGADKWSQWRSGSERMQRLVQLVTNADVQTLVLERLKNSDTLRLTQESTQHAVRTARKMEDDLKRGGLAPGSLLANVLFRSFFQFDQFLVVHGETKQSWYCEIYPFSLFCS